MPGLVTEMESGGRNGARTDHDQNMPTDGALELSTKGQVPAVEAVPTGAQASPPAPEGHARMNDLPPEILHITQGYVPLSLLLTRLAQKTHNDLQAKIIEMARMPIPASAANGSSVLPSKDDDMTVENLKKKKMMLDFLQEMHAKWLKALIITDWSQKAAMVSKLIDLKSHIDQQRMTYDRCLDLTVNVKRDLTYARLPPPDLRTASQIMSKGNASWMPDLNYVEPPDMMEAEQLKWIDELNTLLSLRLNLEDFDKIPPQFKEFSVGSGRVTFKVKGEFEVDLTIADDDYEKQFWFLDFRFNFTPAAPTIPESLRAFLEYYVNATLAEKGLLGCYQFLHEFVLTHKIEEMKRQAQELSRGALVGALIVEPLQRALAIQYWAPSPHQASANNSHNNNNNKNSDSNQNKHWILVAVNSGRKPGMAEKDWKSFLVLKWYRDGKEVKDAEIAFDTDHLMVAPLLETIVGMHIYHLLSSIRTKLLTIPRYKNRTAGMSLTPPTVAPGEMSLALQVGFNDTLVLSMQPVTGLFSLKPQSRLFAMDERRLNNAKDPVEEGVWCIENTRFRYMREELSRRGVAMGWTLVRSPISSEALKSIVRPRGQHQFLFYRREGWHPTWFVMFSMTLAGDDWWIVQSNPQNPDQEVIFHSRLGLNDGFPNLTDRFYNHLALFVTGTLSQSTDLRNMQARRIGAVLRSVADTSVQRHVKLPAIVARLSNIVPVVARSSQTGSQGSNNDVNQGSRQPVSEGAVRKSGQAAAAGSGQQHRAAAKSVPSPKANHDSRDSTREPWAYDQVDILFRGIQSPAEGRGEERLRLLSEAVIRVLAPARLRLLRGLRDRDVMYNSRRGEFRFRVQQPVGEPLTENIATKVKAIDRLVRFVEAMDKCKGGIKCESVSLYKVAFSYHAYHAVNPSEMVVGASTPAAAGTTRPTPPQRWRVVLDLSDDRILIRLQNGNPHIRVLEFLDRLVSGPNGISTLAMWLSISSQMFSAIDKIMTTWDGLDGHTVNLHANNLDWLMLRYVLADGKGGHKRMDIEARLKLKSNEPWWYISRLEPASLSTGPGGKPILQALDDDFGKALKSVWDPRADRTSYRGLGGSMAARPNEGTAEMILAMDEAIRTLAKPIASRGRAAGAAEGGAVSAAGGGGGGGGAARAGSVASTGSGKGVAPMAPMGGGGGGSSVGGGGATRTGSSAHQQQQTNRGTSATGQGQKTNQRSGSGTKGSRRNSQVVVLD